MSRKKFIVLYVALCLLVLSSGIYLTQRFIKSSADTTSSLITNYIGYHQGNLKKSDLFYTQRPIIVVKDTSYPSEMISQSDINEPMHRWSNILPAVSIAIWNDGLNQIQKIPVVSLRGESIEDVFRTYDFSSVYFIKQYQPTKVIIPDDQSLYDALTMVSANGPNLSSNIITRFNLS